MRAVVLAFKAHSFTGRDGKMVEGFNVCFGVEASGWTGMKAIEDHDHKVKMIFVSNERLNSIDAKMEVGSEFDIEFKPGTYHLASIE